MKTQGWRSRYPRPHDDQWRIPDQLWERMEPLIPPPKPHPLGCHKPRTPHRTILDAIFFVLRTGCQWKALDATKICSGSVAHYWFQEWTRGGVFEQLWALGLKEYDARKGIQWAWQAMDGAMTKAPLGGEKNREKPHGSGQGRNQAQPLDRRSGHSRGAGRGRGQRQ
jgi:transposase